MSSASRAYLHATAVSQELKRRGYRGRVTRATSLVMIYVVGADGRRIGRSIDHLLDSTPSELAELLIQALSVTTDPPRPRRVVVELPPHPDRRSGARAIPER